MYIEVPGWEPPLPHANEAMVLILQSHRCIGAKAKRVITHIEQMTAGALTFQPAKVVDKEKALRRKLSRELERRSRRSLHSNTRGFISQLLCSPRFRF